MSVQRFKHGAAVPLPNDSLIRLQHLGGRITPDSTGFGQLVTGDGGANVFGLTPPVTSMMWSDLSGKLVFNLLYVFIDRVKATVVPAWGYTAVTSASLIKHLPRELVDRATVVASGAELLAAVND